MSWLLCDFGEVLSLPQEAEVVSELAAVCGQPLGEFEHAYYRHRLDYDAGRVSAAGFWSEVCGRELAPGGVAQLVELDARSWLNPNAESLRAVERAGERGLRLAILSNMPLELARIVEGLDWIKGFEQMIFSCDLGMAKPEPEIYAKTLELLDAPSGEVHFIDDRAANVQAALAAGLRAEVFTQPAQIDRIGG